MSRKVGNLASARMMSALRGYGGGASGSPAGAMNQRRVFNITPAHLKKVEGPISGDFDGKAFEARRRPQAFRPSTRGQLWQTSAQAMNEEAHGARAYL